MPLAVLVTNQPPEIDENVPEPLKDLFQGYIRAKDGKAYPLFRHQAEVFRRVSEDQEVFLVAGTAAGKTLAIAVPLFHKLREGTLPDDRARLAFHVGIIPEMGQLVLLLRQPGTGPGAGLAAGAGGGGTWKAAEIYK